MELLEESLHQRPPLWLAACQVGAGTLLALAAILSLALNVRAIVRKRRGGYIQLNTSAAPPANRREAFDAQILANVDDLGDRAGKNLHVDAFWRHVKPRRYFLLLLMLAGTALQGYRDFSILTTSFEAWDLVEVVVLSSTSSYSTLLTLCYCLTSDVERHRSLTFQLFLLTAASILVTYFLTIGQYLAFSLRPHIGREAYASLGLGMAQAIFVGLILVRPPEHEDMTRLYNKAVVAAMKEQGPTTEEPNVISERGACVLSQLTYSWILPTLTRASKMDQIDVQDLPALHTHLRAQNVVRDVMHGKDQGISQSRFGPTVGLMWTVWALQWGALLQETGLAYLLVPLWYVPHICLQNILYALDHAVSKQSAAAWAIALVLGRVANLVILCCQLNIAQNNIAPRIRAHSSFLLFKKLLTRNTFASTEGPKEGKNKVATTKADILNLVSSDVQALSQIGFTMVGMLRTQLEMLCGCFYVWLLLGPSGLWGLATLLFTSIPAYFITKLQYKVYENQLEVKDEKISLMQEAVQAIAMIKMMAAERFWFKRIKEVRDREFKKVVQARMLGLLSGMLYSAGPTIVVVVAFAHYTLVAKKSLTATIAFTSIAVFDELRPVLLDLPRSIAQLLQQILSAKRIGSFIRARDLDYFENGTERAERDPTGPLYITGTIGWDNPKAVIFVGPSRDNEAQTEVTPAFRLQDIDIQFPRGKFTLVAGKFGSGKSLMLLALLGEASLIEGKISYAISDVLDPDVGENMDWSLVPTGVAYVPQTAWLQSMSIRENVLFGLPLDMQRYKTVFHAVGLLPDLEILEDADLTEIGERGKILSGGQKARVSLARAVYSRAATLVLDDVISAVDAQTSQHIIQHCFKSPLMAGRTVIIASHAVEALAPLADQAIFLDAGRVVWEGEGPTLLESEHMAHLKTESDSKAMLAIEPEHSGLGLDRGVRRGSEGKKAEDFEVKKEVPKTPRQLIIEEERAKGAVDSRHWRDLIAFNGGVMFWLGMATVMLAGCLLPVGERRVLEIWTGEAAEPQEDSRGVMFWVILYASLATATVIIEIVFALLRFWGGLRATKAIHIRMLESLLRAKMVFFSKTRAGSIIQRFGQDLTDVLECSELVGELTELAVYVAVALVSVTVYGGWIFAVITVALFAAVIKPSEWYRSAGRQVRRLQAVLPGGVNAMYGETVAGTAVIRAFGVQSVFVKELLRLQNMRINANVWRMYIARWLMINLRLMDVIINSTALVLILNRPGMTGGAAGFILAFAGTITTNVNWMLINIRQVELAGVSLERTAEYRMLDREDGEPLDSTFNDQRAGIEHFSDALEGWPEQGKLKVQDLSASYGPELPEILHEVSFEVEGGQRIGIVGASGGGKSTLAKAFFSFVDITHGRIEIDGKNIANIPLGHVRSKLGIIAQDPILLSGSLRLNLDIEGAYSDDQLYDALRQVQLIKRSVSSKMTSDDAQEIVDATQAESNEDQRPISDDSSSISSLTVVDEPQAKGKNDDGASTGTNANKDEEHKSIFTNLDYEIKSGGEKLRNILTSDGLSAGQKQLVVLARALLKRHKVLILDEATASIDSATDAEISRVVHEEFKGATVLIIAHRLRTIMPCSKILVMDKGRLVQQGSPLELIKLDGGKFQDLCKAAGPEEYRHLVSLADQAASAQKLIDV